MKVPTGGDKRLKSQPFKPAKSGNFSSDPIPCDSEADSDSLDERRRTLGLSAKHVVMVFRFLLVLVLFSTVNAQSVRVGLGYLPDVQFAPFYLAEVEGLYEAQGLEVEFQHGFVTELYPLLAQGKLEFVVGDAEDVIALRTQDEQGAPFKYVMAMYQQVPNVLFAKADAGITSLEDLEGKTLGMPGLFGTSYTSLQATLEEAGLQESDLTIEQIGFTQVEAVLSDRVDVAMGFVNNEPIILRQQGVEVSEIPAGEYNPSAGNGVITTERVLEDEELVRRFLSATQAAMVRTLEDPDDAFEASKTFVDNLGDERREVLMTSLPLYTSDYSDANGIGFTDPAGWAATLELLKRTGRISTELDAETFYSNEYLEPGVGTE